MIIPDKKKVAAIIVSKMNGEGKEEMQKESDKMRNEGDDTKINIMSDLFHAYKINSPKMAAQAMDAYFDLMMQSKEMSDDGEEEME